MGRNKINPEEKKNKLTVALSKKNIGRFDEFEIKNKSKLIEWLLNEYFTTSINNI